MIMDNIFNLYAENLKNNSTLLQEINSSKNYKYSNLNGVIFYLDNLKYTDILLITNTSIDSYLLVIASIFSSKRVTLISDQIGIFSIKNIISNYDLLIHPSNFKIEDLNIKSVSYKDVSKDELNHITFKEIFIREKYETIFLSSGSTGTPKKIPLNLRNFNECFKAVFLKIQNIEFLNSVQYCIHDPSFVIIFPYLMFSLKYKSILLVPPDQSSFIQKILLFNKSRANILISVPSIIKSIVSVLKDYEGTQLLISCGEPLFKADALNIIKKFKPNFFHNFYGSTEVSPWIFSLDVIEYLKQYNEDFILPIGEPLDGCIVKSLENELLVSCNWTFSGYLNNDNSIDRTCFIKENQNNFYKTSDRIRKKGKFFYCEGRIGMEQKVSGIRINIYEVEAMLLEINYISQAVVNISNNKLKILIYQDKSKTKNQDALRKYLYQYLDKRIPIGIDYSIEKLKLNKSGKIDRSFYKDFYK